MGIPQEIGPVLLAICGENFNRMNPHYNCQKSKLSHEPQGARGYTQIWITTEDST